MKIYNQIPISCNKFLLLLAISIYLSSCAERCPLDPKVQSTFAYHFTMLKSKKRNLGLSMDYIETLIFFSSISGIKSKANFGDVSVYNRHRDYKSDIRNYTKWYQENKCKISREKVEAVHKECCLD